jgi:N-acetylglucosaminyl-diphospho-decaprenol L-rhamnosyltransferase
MAPRIDNAPVLAVSNAMLRLSVVIPTHGTRELTLRCVDSLDACVPGSSEVIVVDDGSTDGTDEALRDRHPRVKILSLAPARGFTAAANLGMREASGDLILLLNSDTEVGPTTVPRLLSAFDADPQLAVAGAELRSPDGRLQWSAGHAPTLPWLFLVASGIPHLLQCVPGYRLVRPGGGARRRTDWVCAAAMMVRRQAWIAAGGFDERFNFYCQDLDLCVRLRAAGWRVNLVSGARVTHIGGATIGQLPGAARDRSHPELLWTDLVRWAAKHGGPSGARAAAWALRFGGALRVGARHLVAPFVARDRHEAWARDTRAFQRALAALTQNRPPRS